MLDVGTGSKRPGFSSVKNMTSDVLVRVDEGGTKVLLHKDENDKRRNRGCEVSEGRDSRVRGSISPTSLPHHSTAP